MEDEYLSKNADEHMIEISDYVMLRLYRDIYNNKLPSKDEYETAQKIQSL